LSAKCPHWLNPPSPLSVRTHHKFRKIPCFLRKKVLAFASEGPPPPLSTKCPHWTNPLSPDCRRLLWTAPYHKTRENLGVIRISFAAIRLRMS